jgi:glycosyltransferase involved in cell wall biosynthesis
VSDYVKEELSAGDVVLARGVSETSLYSLHAHAAATVVPTLFEAGFPWQALEAMLVKTPAIVSRIPAVMERLARFGIDAAGLRLFDPYDVGTLAIHMREALVARESIVRDQEAVRAKLFEYSWNDTADAYFGVMDAELARLAASA